MKKLTQLTFLLFVVISFQSCRQAVSIRRSEPSVPNNVFDAYLNTDIPPADGFDFPIGDVNGQGSYTDLASGVVHNGWYVATQFNEQYSLGIHTGEDWNGSGGGSTDLGQPVHAVANGRVVFAEHCGRLWGNVVIIEHHFYENNERHKILSLYAHLNEIKVAQGEKIQRRQVVATVGQDPEKLFSPHLHLELRWDDTLAPTYWPSSDGKDQKWMTEHYAAPTRFINGHRSLPVPQSEANLILVDQDSYRTRLYRRGELLHEYDVAFGQGKGQKLVEGDNKTPKGMYFVVEKYRGRFDQPYGEYYGGHWIKINYPNRYDAERGRTQQIISPEQASSIAASWERRELTAQDTRLGGGIGFHGWNKEWGNDGPRHLSWGCVVMHLTDISDFYDQIPKGTMVVIF